MPKRIALKDSIKIDTVDLSDFARAVTFTSEHARIDVSGFSASGINEYLLGENTQTITVEFFGSYGATEVHATLYPKHAARTPCEFRWRPDQTSPVSATNPELQGNVLVLKYDGPKGKRGDVDTWDVDFVPSDATGLTFVTVDAGP